MSAWSQIWARPAEVPHALLLTGPEGTGKGLFARAMAARLLCEAPMGEFACGVCASCRWLAADSHPDLRLIIPEADAAGDETASDTDKKKASRQIVIDQIRSLEDFVYLGGHRNGARVVVIEPAEAMNAAAANSLLKILEEPPVSVYFILTSSRWRRLLPTVLSRCRRLNLPRPMSGEAKAWIKQQGVGSAPDDIISLLGEAPLSAVEELRKGTGAIFAGVLGSLAEPGRDPLVLAARWQTQVQIRGDAGMPMEDFIRILQRWLFDLMLAKVADRSRFQGSRAAAVQRLAAGATSAALIRCYNDLMKFRALASHPLNPQLFLEDIAERYLRALAGEKA